jgi:pimeloyl-ACP methyl ester carboxylesterase
VWRPSRTRAQQTNPAIAASASPSPASSTAHASTASGAFLAGDGLTLRYTHRQAGHRQFALVAPGLFMRRDCPEHLELADRLLATTDVVTLDGRGHGDSDGSFSGGSREPADLAALARELRASYDRVTGIGFSFGGYNVAAAAARYAAFDAVALVATPASFNPWDRRFLSRGLFRGLRTAFRRRAAARVSLAALRRRPPALLGLIGQVAPAPLLIVHGANDWLVHPDHARALYAAAAAPKALLLLAGARHAESIVAERPDALLAGLTRLLSGDPQATRTTSVSG